MVRAEEVAGVVLRPHLLKAPVDVRRLDREQRRVGASAGRRHERLDRLGRRLGQHQVVTQRWHGLWRVHVEIL
jgi:hypothetical protein